MSKIWEKAWTYDEIRENSGKWTLAGDVALLHTLKSFSDNLLNKADVIGASLKQLTDDLDAAELELNLTRNHFDSLSNTQFIERRVYEDDETVDQSEVTLIDTTNRKLTEDDVKRAVDKGLAVYERTHETVAIDVDALSDDSDGAEQVLRPIDPYLDRPLPYVIGSEEWYGSKHGGLDESTSEDDDDDDDEEVELQESSQSEIEFTTTTNIPENSDEISLVVPDNEVNTRPIAIIPRPNLGLFVDEPPPLAGEDNGGNLEPSNDTPIGQKKFGGLFDDTTDDDEDQDDIFKTQNVVKPYLKPFKQNEPLFSDEPPEINDQKKPPPGGVAVFGGTNLFPGSIRNLSEESDENFKEIEEKPKIRTLFDDEDDSDDDIFKKNITHESLNQGTSLFSDEPPELVDNKKPTGGVSIFGGSNLFPTGKIDNSLKKPLEKEKIKTLSLFDDDDSDNDIFKVEPTNKPLKKFSLFTDEPSDELDKKEPQMNPPPKDKINQSLEKSKTISLFDDDDEDENDIFNVKPLKKTTSLFDDDDDEPSEIIEKKKPIGGVSIFGDSNLFSGGKFDSEKSKKIDQKPKTSSLFDDEDDSDNDFFKIKKTENFSEKSKSTSLFDDSNDDHDIFKNTEFKSDDKVINEEKLEENSEKIKEKLKIPDLFSEEKPVQDIFENEINTEEIEENPKKMIGEKPKIGTLFEDSDEDEIFKKAQNKSVDHEIVKTEKILKENEENSKNMNLVDDSDDIFKNTGKVDKTGGKSMEIQENIDISTRDNLEKTDKNMKNEKENEAKSRKTVEKKSITTNLFDDNEEIVEIKNEDTPDFIRKNPPTNLPLFGGSSPPPVDDWEKKSDESSDDLFNSNNDSIFIDKKSSLYDEEPPEIITKTKKLVHNLDINVKALLPQEKPIINRENRDETVEILPSITKGRARLPPNRRPSTRKGRKDALMKQTNTDFQLENEEIIFQNQEKFVNIEKSDENCDLIRSEPMKSQDVKIGKSIFDDSDDDDDIFMKIPVKKPVKTVNIFDDDDDDETDIFQTVKKEKKTMENRLFDDDHDKNIFQTIKTVKDTHHAAITKTASSTSGLVKRTELIQTSTMDDPLSIFSQNQ